ncbi:MAG: hypothetical protein AMXMBFR33_41490 [Candidatus Xenobia bacterium]
MGWNVIGWIKERFGGTPPPPPPPPAPPAPAPRPEMPADRFAPALDPENPVGQVGLAAIQACRTASDRQQLQVAFGAVAAGFQGGALGPAVARAYLKAYNDGMSKAGYADGVRGGLTCLAGLEPVDSPAELVASCGAASLGSGNTEERCKLAHAFSQSLSQSEQPLKGLVRAYRSAASAGLSWEYYDSSLLAGWQRLGRHGDPQTAEFARSMGKVQKAADPGRDRGRIGSHALDELEGETPGRRLAGLLDRAANEGMSWQSFRASSLQAFRELEKSSQAPADERDLAAVARTCLEACKHDENGGKVAWSFLKELQRGTPDPGARRLARTLLDASDRSLSWENYSRVIRVGLEALEADGPEAAILEAGARSMDACKSDVDRGKVGRSLMRQLSHPLSGPPEVAVARMMSAASDENMSWESYGSACEAALTSLRGFPLEEDSRLYLEVACASLAGGRNAEERGKLGRAFLAGLTSLDPDRPGKALARAFQQAAQDNLSWEGYADALKAGLSALRASGRVGESLDAALAATGTAQSRCQSYLAGLERMGPLLEAHAEVKKLVSNPASPGVEVREQQVTVGGVRIKVRREEPSP